MKKEFNVFMEGVADARFFKQHINHLFGETGALEDLLENIINPNNRPILDCWEDYEKELVKLDIPDRTPPPLTTPAKKTKIYGYLEALLGESKSQKELIKEASRDYENAQHWNLDAGYLEPLKGFVVNNISE